MKSRLSPIRKILHVRIDNFEASVAQVLHSQRYRQLMQMQARGENRMAISFDPAVADRLTRHQENFAHQFLRILSRFSSHVEPVAAGEARIDLTGYEYLWISPEYAAMRIRETIKKDLELNAQVGIATTYHCARVAACSPSAFGVVSIPAGDEARFLAPQDISQLSGVGSRTSGALLRMGIRTIGDLARLSPEICRELFGPTGIILWKLANGQDPRPATQSAQKSFSASSQMIGERLASERLEQALETAVVKLHRRLHEAQASFQTVCIRHTLKSANTIQHQESFDAPLAPSATDFLMVCRGIAYKIPIKADLTQVVAVTVSASQLTYDEKAQQRLMFPEYEYSVYSQSAPMREEGIEDRGSENESNHPRPLRGLVMEGSAP